MTAAELAELERLERLVVDLAHRVTVLEVEQDLRSLAAAIEAEEGTP